MLIVLDTNVLVSALINPSGSPASILALILEEKIAVCYDARILLEYEEVLQRPKFNFELYEIHSLLINLKALGHPTIPGPHVNSVLDPDDQPFAQVALGASAIYLITGNTAHFPEHIGKTDVVTPKKFLDLFFASAG